MSNVRGVGMGIDMAHMGLLWAILDRVLDDLEPTQEQRDTARELFNAECLAGCSGDAWLRHRARTQHLMDGEF